jgi:hypothetical protein
VCVEQRKTKFRRGKFSYKEISLRKQVDEWHLVAIFIKFI